MRGLLRAWLLVSGLNLGLAALQACATSSAECREQVSACLERCQSAKPDEGPALSSLPPQSTMTECERRCQCRPSHSEPERPGKPTFTGTERDAG